MTTAARGLVPWAFALSGIVLVGWGVAFSNIWVTLPATAAAHDFILVVALVAASLSMSWLTKWRAANCALLLTLVLLARFVGVSALLAGALVVAASIVIGARACRSLAFVPGYVKVLCGLAILTGVTGWLLPFKVHYFWVYAALLSSISFVGRRHVYQTIRRVHREWLSSTQAAPGYAFVACVVVAVTAFSLLPPTVQFDDLAYHLLLPNQLAHLARYKMDVSTQSWALAPWASDILQGYIAVLGDGASRGAANLIWGGLSLAALMGLGRAIGLDARFRWLSLTLFASIPIVSAAAGSMQSESAITAASVALVAMVARAIKTRNVSVVTPFLLLSALLLALKVSQVLLILPLAVVMICVYRPMPFLGRVAAKLPMLVLICGSSYLYAWVVTRNPVFPLYNGVFKSPFGVPVNYADPRWRQGVHWDSLWQITFHTNKFQESYAGAFGFSLLAVAGCIVIALFRPGVRSLVLSLLVSLIATFGAIQYARYLIPTVAPLIPLALTGWQYIRPRLPANVLLTSVAALNVVFIPSSIYTLAEDINWNTLLGFQDVHRRASELSEHFAPERIMAQYLMLKYHGSYGVLLAEPTRPFVGPFEGRALALSSYDPVFASLAVSADGDPSGAQWDGLLRQTGLTHVITFSPPQGALGAALTKLGATAEFDIGGGQLWRICGDKCIDKPAAVFDRRDSGRRLFKHRVKDPQKLVFP
jgi:hypothetical protein